MDASRQPVTATANELAALNKELPRDWPEVWHGIAGAVFCGIVSFRSQGITEKVAAEMARRATEAVVETFGGAQLYLVSGASWNAKVKADRIRQEFNGSNIAELARRHGCSDMRVRQILGNGKSRNRR